MYSKEPDPDNSLDGKNVFEPDPDDSQVNEILNSKLFLGTDGILQGHYTCWKAAPVDMLVSETVKNEANNGSDSNYYYVQAKHLDFDKTIEPDPDDSLGDYVIHVEPDPDDSQENDFIHAEPDPDDAQETDSMHTEPDPDDKLGVPSFTDSLETLPALNPHDAQEPDFMHAEPDPDDKLGVSSFIDSFETLSAPDALSSWMVYKSEIDILSSHVSASSHDEVTIDDSQVMPSEAAKRLGTLLKAVEEMIRYHCQTVFWSLHEAKPLNMAKCGAILVGIPAAGLVKTNNPIIKILKSRFTPCLSVSSLEACMA